MHLTIKDIAGMANTSVATISRVLSGKPGVSEAKRREILKLLDSVGYRPNRIAQTLAMGRSNVIGVVVSNLQIPFYAQIIAQLERSCNEAGRQILVADSYHDPERERHNIETLREHRADGLFIIPVHEYNTRASCDHLLQLRLEKFPFVLIGRVEGFDFDQVTFEEEQTAYQLGRRLIELGHRRFGFLGYDPVNRTVVERFRGLTNALQEHGCKFTSDDIVEEVGTWAEGGVKAWRGPMGRLYSQSSPPTALVAANDTIALIAIRNIEQLGLSVPGNVSVAGFDDSSFAELTNPAITTHAKNIPELARVASTILCDRIDEPGKRSEQRWIEQKLILRDSTGPAPALQMLDAPGGVA